VTRGLRLVVVLTTVPLSSTRPIDADAVALSAVRVEHRAVVNDLEVPIVALVRERFPAGTDTFATVIVAAGDARPVRLRVEAEARVQFEPISLDVGRRPSPSECAPSSDHTLFDVPGLEETLKTWRFDETPDGRATIAAAEAVAQIDLQMKQDEKDRIRLDPMRMRIDLNRTIPSDPIGAVMATQERRQEAMDQLTSDIADLVLAWSAVDRARLQLYYDQAKTLEPLVRQSRLALAAKQHDFQRLQVETRAGAAFLALAHEQLALAADRRPPGETNILSGPTLMCGVAQRGLDYLAVQAASDSRSVLLAHVTFDKGGPLKTLARRVVNSDRWLVPVYWPVDATRASLTLRASRRSRPAASAEVAARRASDRQLLASYSAAAKKIEHDFKDANFRAAGADSLRTVIIR
jgi:hypothetical protein